MKTIPVQMIFCSSVDEHVSLGAGASALDAIRLPDKCGESN